MSRSLVNRATAEDGKEVTGFTLKELAQHSHTSLSACTDLLELLSKRLNSSDSPDVKYKCLKCIKYLCLHGRNEFRIDLQRDPSAVKNAMHFKGPNDPLRGDAPNQRVRDEAKEAMNALYNGPNTSLASTHSATTGRIEGYGGGGAPTTPVTRGSPTQDTSMQRSSSYNHGYGDGIYSSPSSQHGSSSGGSNGSRMVGFGNPAFDNRPASPSFLSKMKAKLTRDDHNSHKPNFKPYERPGGYTGPSSTFTPPPMATLDGSSQRKRGEVGGVWASENASHIGAGSASASAGASAFTSSPQASGASATHTPTPTRPTSSTGEYERHLIDTLTPSAGVRTTPSKDELNKFAHACASLDKILLARIIAESKLTPDTHPITQMKALCLLECLLAATAHDQATLVEVEDWLCDNAQQTLETLETQGTTPPIRNKAVRIMEMIGLREEKKPQPKPHSTAVAANGQQAKHGVDLLGFAEPAAPAADSNGSSAFNFLESSNGSATTAASPAAGASDSSLFDSLEIRDTAAAGSKDAFDLFSSNSQPSASPAAFASASSLDFLDTSSASAASTSSSSAATHAPASSPSINTTKVDPLTALMSNAKITQHQQQQQPQQQQQGGPYGSPIGGPAMGKGMGMGMGMGGGYGHGARAGPGMPPLGPPQQLGYPGQMQMGGMQGGMGMGMGGPMGGMGRPGMGAPGMGMGGMGMSPPSRPIGASTSADLFNVKAAGAAGSSSLPRSTRPTIDLDPQGNPIVFSPTTSTSTAGSGAGNKTGSGGSSSAFGFVSESSDTFGFVNEMMHQK